MHSSKQIIPSSSTVYLELQDIVLSSKLVIFSGLPGVGKSLYIQEFQRIAKEEKVEVDVIQWDVARKSFETKNILQHFPIGNGTVHDGLKIIAGLWLMDVLKQWISQNEDNAKILLIEAPLVGHRFVELVHPQEDEELEAFLKSEKTKVVVPIPTAKVRRKIEEERMAQVSEDAIVWSGAKPSVMLMLWKMTCEIANKFGMDIDLSEQPPYSDGIYEYVFGEILKHRNFVPLIIEEVYDVPEQDEKDLHNEDSIKADETTADKYGKHVIDKFSEQEISEIVSAWYLT